MILTDRLTCPLCGCRYFPATPDQAYCRTCGPPARPVYICERCERETVAPLVLVNDELVCGPCSQREPDPTPEEIEAACLEIRREWAPGEAYQRLMGIVESESEQGPS